MILFAPILLTTLILLGPQFSMAEIIAIIDTGLDSQSELVRGQLWTNPREIPGNGLDDDGDGFIDDVHGWNFSQNNADLTDQIGHGTHVAHLIATKATEGGVLNQLMILKYFRIQNSAEENFKNCLKAFRYAIDHGATVINFSGGGYGTNAEEQALLAEAEQKNILIIAAAGNDHSNNDRTPFFPASSHFRNILSVGSISAAGIPSRFSNYGSNSVSLFYFGENIESLSLGGKKARMSGTSQATAQFTGELIKLMSEKEFSREDLADKVRLSSGQDQRFHPEILRAFRDSKQTALGVRFYQVLTRTAALH